MADTKDVSTKLEKKEVVEVKVIQFGMPNKSWKKLFIWALVVYFGFPIVLALLISLLMSATMGSLFDTSVPL